MVFYYFFFRCFSRAISFHFLSISSPRNFSRFYSFRGYGQGPESIHKRYHSENRLTFLGLYIGSLRVNIQTRNFSRRTTSRGYSNALFLSILTAFDFCVCTVYIYLLIYMYVYIHSKHNRR